MFSHNVTEWSTPPELFKELDNEFRFDLDPCTTNDNPLGTKYYFTKEDNGLEKTWIGSSVFINPPYDKEIKKWIQKTVNELGTNPEINKVVMLLPSRTDTSWMHEYIWDSKHSKPKPGIEIRFIKGRLKFRGAKSSAPFPSMIVVFSR